MIDLLLDVVAAYRLTKLVTDDVITQHTRDEIIRHAYEAEPEHHDVARSLIAEGHDVRKPRGWQQLVELDDDPPKMATLITCRWCAGMWIGAGVVLARRVAPRSWDVAARALTLSAGSALVAGLER